MLPRRSRSVWLVAMTAMLTLVGIDLAPAAGGSPRPSSPKVAGDGVAVFRGTTSFSAAAREQAAQPAAGLSLDRIHVIEEEHEEHELPVPAAAAPAVDGVPIAGEPSGLLREFAGLDAFDNESVTGFNFEPAGPGPLRWQRVRLGIHQRHDLAV